MRLLLGTAVERVIAFRDRIRDARVTPAISAADIRAHLSERYGDFTEPWAEGELVDGVSWMFESWQVQVGHPRYFGLFNPPTRPAAVAADLLVAGFNPQLAAWSHSPAANEIERHTLRYLAGRLGLDPDGTAATFTTAGAEANQSALLAALNHAYPDYRDRGLSGARELPVIYVSSESHHSIEKAAMTSGLGRRAVRTVAVDERLRMNVSDLRAAIREDRRRGRKPLMVVGTAGTTGGGIVDPLDELAALCAHERLWFHVDAAWGGAACLSPRLASAVAGIERADSVTWDAHKWLCVPMGAGMFFCKHPEAVRRAFAVATPYMPPDINDTTDPYTWTIQWSRRHIGLKVFMSLAALGEAGTRAAIERQADMGDLLRRELGSRGWRIVNETRLPVVCFTRPEIDRGDVAAAQIASRIEERFWISPVRLGGRDPVLRACVTSYETNEADITALAEAVTSAVRSENPGARQDHH